MHPLDPLAADEITAASALVRTAHAPGALLHFKNMELVEPPKAELRPYLAAERAAEASGAVLTVARPARQVAALYYLRTTVVVGSGDSVTAQLLYTVVDLDASTVVSKQALDGAVHAQADPDETKAVRAAVLADARVVARVAALGLPDDMEAVCDSWPYGRNEGGTGPRLAQCYFYARARGEAGWNLYDHPLPFAAVADSTTRTVVRVVELPLGVDAGVAGDDRTYLRRDAATQAAGQWHHDLRPTAARADVAPLVVQQPQGASFAVAGHRVTWQKWRFRVGFNWREGLVLHDVTYGGRTLFHRLSLSEMFVPYGDPRAPYSRKSVFDVGDIGAGVAANNLALGCDCLGRIRYFSFVVSDSAGRPVPRAHAVCMHEIDDGLGWKHTDTATGAVSVVRSRVLVLQTIITVGNYEYVFQWHLDQAAALHYRIQATGILSTAPIAPGVQVPWGVVVNEGVLAANHQHIFALRIDPALDGDANTVVEEDTVAMPWDDALNADGVGFVTQQRVIETSGPSAAAPNRVLKIVNRAVRNPVSGRPVAYAVHAGGPRQMLLAHPQSWHARRAVYATQPFWVTAYRDGELYAAGTYTYQSLPAEEAAANAAKTTPDGLGLGLGLGPAPGDVGTWAARGDKVADADLVLWHAISLTHNPRPEDYPVMPVETMTVSLKPSGFFTANPALDVPQSTQRRNQSVLDTEGGEGAGCCEAKL